MKTHSKKISLYKNVSNNTFYKNRKEDSGAILIVVMLVMMTLMGIGVTAMWLTGGNLTVGANMNQRTQALYVAEAGLEQAKVILNGAADLDLLLAGSNPALDNVPVALDTLTNEPIGIGALLVDAGGGIMQNIVFPPVATDFGRAPSTADNPASQFMGTYTLWIRNDTAEARIGSAAQNFVTDLNSSVVVRSVGLAPDGRTNVVIEAIMAPDPGAAGGPAVGTIAPVNCAAGKNGCGDNSSTAAHQSYI